MRALVKRGRQLADWVILERKMYTILTVEDDLHINNLLKEALGKAGYACSQAFSGTEALLWLERNECQLILLDLMLPGLSGEEVLQQIRQTSNVSVIVMLDGPELGHLTRQECAILELLLEHPGQVFSKEAVFTYAWQEEYMGETKTLDVHISNIRKKIKKITEQEYIQTVWGIGYCMVAHL